MSTERTAPTRTPQAGKRIVTHEMAREAVRKYHGAVYNGKPAPSLHVPPHPEDVDVILADYIEQQSEAMRPATDCSHGKMLIEPCPECGREPLDVDGDQIVNRRATDVGTEPTDERAEFEEWYEADAMPLEADWFKRDEDGDYVLDHVQHYWLGWQAKAARSSVESPWIAVAREIDKWCSGENQVEDGEDAEFALRRIQILLRPFLAPPTAERSKGESQ